MRRFIYINKLLTPADLQNSAIYDGLVNFPLYPYGFIAGSSSLRGDDLVIDWSGSDLEGGSMRRWARSTIDPVAQLSFARFLNSASALPFTMHGHELADAWNKIEQQGSRHA